MVCVKLVATRTNHTCCRDQEQSWIILDSPPIVDSSGSSVPDYFFTLDQAVGLVGALIMPHNIYLHSAVVLSREVDRSSSIAMREAIFYVGVEVAVTLAVSTAVMEYSPS